MKNQFYPSKCGWKSCFQKKCSVLTLQLIFLFGSFFSFTPAYSQTVLFSNNFETTTSLEGNGWTVVNPGTNKWVGGKPFLGSFSGAFISNSSYLFLNNYTTNTLQNAHFYRNVSLPAAAANTTLTFDYSGMGELDYDRILVYIAPTSVTPTTSVPAKWQETIPGATLIFNQTIRSSSFNTASLTIPASYAGTTFRLIFTWQNDDNGGSNPAGAVDNISMTYCTPATLSATSTQTCVGGSTGTITASASGGSTPYTYSLNSGTYQSSTTFTGLNAGNYTLNVKTNAGCVTSESVTVTRFANSTASQTTTATNSWIGHMYDGTNFENYIGQFTEPEIFDESYGGATTCFNVTSNSVSRSIFTETYSVKYRMNSTKNGLYAVNLGSDDGSRLTVDGTMIYDNWVNQSFSLRPAVLLNLDGSSSLLYEFYEVGSDNRVIFQNLTQILANTLSVNTTQNICIGNTGSAISGDAFGTLPSGISRSGTGYQWSYSTTLAGTGTNIAGATGATFTPSANVAPFNTADTFYLFRKAIVSSINNISPNPYVATNESNAATVIVRAAPSATISYAGGPYCFSAATIPVIRTGTTGGTYSSTAGLSINATTGAVDISASSPGTYLVTYTIAASGGCAVYTTSTNVQVLSQISNNQLNYVNGINGVICASVAENSVATLTAPAGAVFSTIDFASFGTSTGDCSAFVPGACHAAGSQTIAESYLLGNNAGSIPSTNAIFTDPCTGVVKRLNVKATYTLPICSGTSPGIITGSMPVGGSGSYTYLWEISITGSSAGFTTAPGISNTRDYNPGVLTQTTWFRRRVTSAGCTDSKVIQVTVTPLPVISQVPATGLTSNYKFTGNANDATGNNNGVLQNGPASVADRFGIANSAYSFNGTNQHVTTTNSFTNPAGFTMSVWFKTNTTTGGKLIGFGNSQTGSSSSYDRHIYMNNSGQIFFGVYPGNVVTVNSSLSYNDDKWHLATATLSPATGMALYVDGVLVGSNSITTSAENYTGYIRIGYDNVDGWSGQPSSFYFKGVLDDVLFYGRALDASEVVTIYSSPDGAGNSGPVCAGSSITLSSTSIPGATYAWTGPAAFTSTQQNPSFSYTVAKAGVYKVIITSPGGCSATAYTNVVSSANTGQWTGSVSTDWANALNWCDGVVPGNNTDVTITSGAVRMPVISGVANAKSLAVQTGATVTTNASGTLNIAGLITNNGTMTNNGTTVFNGTSGQQTFSGVTAFNHFTVNNSNGLILPSAITTQNITLTSGTLNANNFNITVKGNWINNASASAFAGGTNNVLFTGTTPQTIGGNFETVFHNLTASNVGSTITLTNNIKIVNNFVVGGVVNLGTFTADQGTSGGGTLYLSTLGHLKIGGTNTLPANYTTNTFLLASKVEYAGTAQTISPQNYGNLILSSSAGLVTKISPLPFTTQANFTISMGAGTGVNFTAAANTAIGNDIIIGANTSFNGGSFTHTIGGNWINDGNYIGNTSTIILNGASKNVGGSGTHNFNNLTIAATGITFSSINLSLTGNLATTGTGSFIQASGGTLIMTGNGATISGSGISLENLTINNSGNVTANNSLTFTGNLLVQGVANTFTGAAGTTIIMSGTNKTISGPGSFAFRNLNVTGSNIASANFSINGNLVVAGSFSATSGTATFTNISSLSGTANLFNSVINGTKLQLASNSTLGIAGTLTITSGILDVTSSVPNTVNYNGPGAQSINAITYNNLTLSNANSKTAIGAITANRNITIGTATTFVSGNYVHSLFGDWINNGTFTANLGTITIRGAATTNITGTSTTTFNILTSNQLNTTTTTVLLTNASASVVNMTRGMILTGTKTLTITSNRTGPGIILGTIQRTHAFNTGVDYAFEGPDNTINFSTVTGVNSVTLYVAKGSISDFPSGAAISRVYNITVPSGTYNAKLRLHYEDNELNGNDESLMNLWNYSGTSWNSAGAKTGNNVSTNYVEQAGLTNITNRWTLSGAVSEFVWSGAIDTDWNKPANWIPTTRIPALSDVVNIGTTNFNHQPTISSAAVAKNIILGSTKPVQLSMAPGGTLTTGNIGGLWSTNATHVINSNNQTISIDGDLALSDGIAGHAINLNIGTGNVSIGGNLTQSGSADITFSGAGILKIANEFYYINGNFTAGTGTVEYNGTDNQIVGHVTYNHLLINKTAGLASIDEPLTVTGNLTIDAGQLVNNDVANVRGNVSIAVNGILENHNLLHVGGNWANAGAYNGIGVNTIFDGTGTQTISQTTFNNLEFNKPVGSVALLTGDVILNGNLVGTSGTLDIGSYNFNREIVGGSASIFDNGTLIVAADNAPNKFANYFLSPGSTVIFNGTGTQNLFLPGVEYGNIIFRNSGIKLLHTPITVHTKLFIENSAIFNSGANTITLNGDWQNEGTFVPGTGTVLWNGLNKTITGATTFNKVTVSGKYNVVSDIVFNDLLTLTPSGAITSGAAQVHILHGDLINSGDLLLLGETVFSGTKLQTLSLLNAVRTVAAIITFNGTVSPVLYSTSAPLFNVLNINNSGGINPSVGWTILSHLNVTAGASFNGGNFTQTLMGSLTNNGIITSTGTFNFIPASPAMLNFGTGYTSTGTTIFGGTGAVTIMGTPVSFKNVTISNSNVAGITPSSNWIMTNDLGINSGSVLNAGTRNYTVGGNIYNNGTLNKGNSLFTLNGTGVQELRSLSSFHNVTINKATGNADLVGDITVAGNLHFLSGNIKTNEFALIQPNGGTLTGAAQNTGWILGNLKKYIATGAASKDFEVGDASYFTPVNIAFDNVNIAGDLLVNTTPSDHPNLNTSVINPGKSVNRYWTLMNSGIGFTKYTATFNFATSDLDLGVNTALFNVDSYNGSSWTLPVTQAPNANNIRANDVTWFGDFAIGEICNFGTTISYTISPYCLNAGTATPTLTGTPGGTFSASEDLSIDLNTGVINLATSTPGSYIVYYTIEATGECPIFVTSATVIVAELPAITSTVTPTCVGGNTGVISVSGTGGVAPYTYSFNSGIYESNTTFTALAAGTYSVSVKDSLGCIATNSIVVSRFANSTLDQNIAGNDTWIGHVYDGMNFQDYIGQFTELENFDESFGGDVVCFGVNSGAGSSSILTQSFSVKFKMNSSKSGLYLVDAGSDDGNRLTVDGALIHNNWSDHSFNTNSVVISLKGNSSLLYEYYENNGGNRVSFNNLVPILENKLVNNLTQSFCLGATGLPISGDSFAQNLPSGAPMPLYGTGYEWLYSTTPGGVKVKIIGAEGASFTPSNSVAPFNVPGTYYIYRNARLQTSYIAIHESNVAVISVLPVNLIAYPNSPYCTNGGTATVSLTGTTGGVYSSTGGLVIDPQTGTVSLAASTPGTYAVTYVLNGSCDATTAVTITEMPSATISYPGTPFCSNETTATVNLTGTQGGIFSSTAGLAINAANGEINIGTSIPGTYNVTYSVASETGCTDFSTVAPITIHTAPYAEGSYAGSPYCSNGGTVYPSGSGTGGGTFTSTPGLSINLNTGGIDLGASVAGVYTVTYTVAGSGGCPPFSWTAKVAITSAPNASISYPTYPCTNTGSIAVNRTGTEGGTYSSTNGLSIDPSTGAINADASIAGTYLINYSIPGSDGCGSKTFSTTIKLGVAGMWTGTIDSDWNKPGNWACGSVPSTATNVTIPSGSVNNPEIFVSGTVKNITIQNGANLIVSGTLQIAGIIDNSGNFDARTGTLEMIGNTAQVLPSNAFQNNSINHLIINNSSAAGVSLLGALDIYSSLIYKGTGRVFNTNDSLTLKSNATGTSWVGDMTGNSITGKVTVEKYNSQNKAWRFLSIPTNTTQTIRESWQEGGTSNTDNPVPGFGVQLTGPGGLPAGFDLYSGTPSIKTFDPAIQNWKGVANTLTRPIKNNEGYMVLVRGNRTSNAFNSPVTESVLRTKGPLYTGSVGPISVIPEKMASIGNPYASSIDFTKITRTNGVDAKFYLWDPFIAGVYKLGGYQIFSEVNNWEPVPGGSPMYPTGVANTTIPSGEAFFVHATTVAAFVPVNYEVSFGENSKISGSGYKFNARPQGGSGARSGNQFFRVSLFTGPLATDVVADGNAVVFGESFSNALDGNDALKIQAGGENFDVKRNQKLLAIEARGYITSADTIYYNMSKLAKKDYQLRFGPVNMGGGDLVAYLEDKFLNTITPISLTDSTFINISITGAEASAAPDRFKVIFKQMTVLPVTLTTVQAKEEGADIALTWGVENEVNMERYEIEKSTNGISFVKAGEVKAKNLKTGTYKWLDENKGIGYNYYRLRSVDLNGKTSLTQVVKVLVEATAPASITIYPNIILNQVIKVQMTNSPAGKYHFRLLNTAGQLIMQQQADFVGGTGSVEINIRKNLASGIYHLEITNQAGNKKVIKVFQ